MDLIIGTAQLTGLYGVLEQSVENSGDEPNHFLHAAYELGFTAVDTAPAYGRAESTIGASELGFEVHTKLDPAMKPRESIKGSLERLDRTFVEVAYLHDPDAAVKDGGEAVNIASDLVGVSIVALGASVYSEDALRSALSHQYIGVVQIPINPLNRRLAEIACCCEFDDTRIIGRSLLAQGLLAIHPNDVPDQLDHLVPEIRRFHDACRQIGRPPVESALLWARDHPALSGIVVGAASISQLVEISSVLQLPALSDDERDVIDALTSPASHGFDPRTWN